MITRRAMVAVVNRALQDARLEHRARFVPAADATVDDMIDIVEVEGGSVVGIQLKDGRFGVNVYDLDDNGEVAASTDAGVFETLSEAADRAVLLLVQC
jgi:hypothetical protein